MDCSLPGSSAHRISQPGILEWAAISFSRGSSRPRDRPCVSCLAVGFFTRESPGKPIIYASAGLCLVALSCLTLCDPMNWSLPGGSAHGFLQARILEWLAMPSSRGSSNPVIEPRFPSLQVDSVPSEPQGESRNTGVGSLFLLQGNFLTQESNQGLLHCRQILHQLSYQGSPIYPYMYIYKFLLCRKRLIKSFFWAL